MMKSPIEYHIDIFFIFRFLGGHPDRRTIGKTIDYWESSESFGSEKEEVENILAGDSSVGRAIDCRSIGRVFNSHLPEI